MMLPHIFPPVSNKIIAHERVVQTRHVNRILGREFERNPVVGMYSLEEGLTTYVLTAIRVDAEVLVFKPEKISLRELAQIVLSEKVMVLCTENAKYQFTAKNMKIDKAGNVICNIPNDLYLIQRREGFRVTPPADESFKLIIGLGAQQELLTNVVNVSCNGLQLDMRAGVTEVALGGYWHTCYFERLSSESGKFNLQIRNTYQGGDVARLKVGCQLYQPSKKTEREFENIVETITHARLTTNLKKWYTSLEWWNE